MSDKKDIIKKIKNFTPEQKESWDLCVEYFKIRLNSVSEPFDYDNTGVYWNYIKIKDIDFFCNKIKLKQ